MAKNFEEFYDTLEQDMKEQVASDLKLMDEMPRGENGRAYFDPDRKRDPLAFRGLRTGFPVLDDYLLGVKQKEIILLGAPSNIGKTQVTLFVALNFATQGKKIAYMFAEDEREDAADMVTSIILSQPELESGLDNVTFFSNEDAGRLIEHPENLIPFIDTLSVKYRYEWFFLDMLNNIVDPLEDKNFGKMMSTLRQHANRKACGHSVWLNCRFREPRPEPASASYQDKFDPDFTRFYGRSTQYVYSVTKALALTAAENSYIPGARNLSLKILKNKKCKIGTIGTRHLVCIDDNLKIWQPAEHPLVGDAPEVYAP